MINYAGDAGNAGDGITQNAAAWRRPLRSPNALCNMCWPTPVAGKASVRYREHIAAKANESRLKETAILCSVIGLLNVLYVSNNDRYGVCLLVRSSCVQSGWAYICICRTGYTRAVRVVRNEAPAVCAYRRKSHRTAVIHRPVFVATAVRAGYIQNASECLHQCCKSLLEQKWCSCVGLVHVTQTLTGMLSSHIFKLLHYMMCN